MIRPFYYGAFAAAGNFFGNVLMDGLVTGPIQNFVIDQVAKTILTQSENTIPPGYKQLEKFCGPSLRYLTNLEQFEDKSDKCSPIQDAYALSQKMPTAPIYSQTPREYKNTCSENQTNKNCDIKIQKLKKEKQELENILELRSKFSSAADIKDAAGFLYGFRQGGGQGSRWRFLLTQLGEKFFDKTVKDPATDKITGTMDSTINNLIPSNEQPYEKLESFCGSSFIDLASFDQFRRKTTECMENQCGAKENPQTSEDACPNNSDEMEKLQEEIKNLRDQVADVNVRF